MQCGSEYMPLNSDRKLVCALQQEPYHDRHVTSEGEWWEFDKKDRLKCHIGKTELVKEKFIYPHMEFIESLLQAADFRRLSKSEVLAITEAQMFESLIEEAVPSLRAALDTTKEGSRESHNAALFLAVACDFAQGMANDVQQIMGKAQRRIVESTEH